MIIFGAFRAIFIERRVDVLKQGFLPNADCLVFSGDKKSSVSTVAGTDKISLEASWELGAIFRFDVRLFLDIAVADKFSSAASGERSVDFLFRTATFSTEDDDRVAILSAESLFSSTIGEVLYKISKKCQKKLAHSQKITLNS